MDSYRIDPVAVDAVCRSVETAERGDDGIATAVGSTDGSLDNLSETIRTGIPTAGGLDQVSSAIFSFFSKRADFKDTVTRVFVVTEAARTVARVYRDADAATRDTMVNQMQSTLVQYANYGSFGNFVIPGQEE